MALSPFCINVYTSSRNAPVRVSAKNGDFDLSIRRLFNGESWECLHVNEHGEDVELRIPEEFQLVDLDGKPVGNYRFYIVRKS